jgi:signal recognition particle receptor subunit beta
MPLDLGPVNGFTTRFHLYTVPGQLYYRRSRRAVLQGVDGIVFVADSAPERERDNLDSLEDLNSLLGTLGFSAGQLARLPRVFQYNKRDVPGATTIDHMRCALNSQGHPELEAVAIEGRGVSETLRIACKAVLSRIGDTSDASGSSPATRAARPAAISVPAPPRKRTQVKATRR